MRVAFNILFTYVPKYGFSSSLDLLAGLRFVYFFLSLALTVAFFFLIKKNNMGEFILYAGGGDFF